MGEELHEMLSFVLENDVGLSASKARSVAAHFSDIPELLKVDEKGLLDIKSITGKRAVDLSKEEVKSILTVRKRGYVDPKESVPQNYLRAISREFTRRQITMIRSLCLTDLNINPFLVKSLNLHTPREIIELNVYMAVTRSIVTSMGFFVEKLLLASSDSIEKKVAGWDFVKTKKDGTKHWIQVKSGPNDMDKDQIEFWAEKIEEKIASGDHAYIGITYGKNTNKTVTLGIMKKMLPDWEVRTLIGRELWDFVSEDPTYHITLFDTLRKSAVSILNKRSLCDEIETCVERMKKEFIAKYGDSANGVNNYIKEIF